MLWSGRVELVRQPCHVWAAAVSATAVSATRNALRQPEPNGVGGRSGLLELRQHFAPGCMERDLQIPKTGSGFAPSPQRKFAVFGWTCQIISARPCFVHRLELLVATFARTKRMNAKAMSVGVLPQPKWGEAPSRSTIYDTAASHWNYGCAGEILRCAASHHALSFSCIILEFQ